MTLTFVDTVAVPVVLDDEAPVVVLADVVLVDDVDEDASPNDVAVELPDEGGPPPLVSEDVQLDVDEWL